MKTEEQIAAALRSRIEGLGAPAADAGAVMHARRKSERRRAVRRTVAAVASVAAVAAAAALLAQAVGPRPGPNPSQPPNGQWVELPAPPMTPRTDALGVWTGDRALFLGGEVARHCPVGADCVRQPRYARDGAAYDPVSRKWTPVPDAPFPVSGSVPHAVAGGDLVVVHDNRWYAYALAGATWRRLPDPPSPNGADSLSGPISAHGETVASLRRDGTVLTLDMSTQRWSALPRSPHRPALDSQSVVPTSEGIVVVGTDSTKPNDGRTPSYLLAEVHVDGKWRRLPPSDMVGGYTWHWTGERLISPYFGCVDGGKVNPYPRCVPEGGVLDPDSDSWAPLPMPPAPPGTGSVAATGDRVLVGGLLYDDGDESWSRIQVPDEAASYVGTSAVVSEHGVIAFGGIDWGNGQQGGPSTTNRAWGWSP